MTNDKCRLCGAMARQFETMTLLDRHAVRYFRCPTCDLIQTEPPYWLDEAYTSALADIDLGGVARPMRLAPIADRLLMLLLDPTRPCVDYGGGHGIFTRMMRDRGFDFFHFDRYAEPLYAKHFIARRDVRYELATAFEVFEHLPNPEQDIEELLGFARNVFFTTLLVPPTTPTPDWWYYAHATGQHVAFYSRETLAFIAKRHGLHYYTDGVELHLFTERPWFGPYVRDVLEGRLWTKLLRRRALRKHKIQSRLVSDWEAVANRRMV